MHYPTPNARFEHIFVVVRRFIGDGPPDDEVMLTKAFWTEDAADAEAERLNAENAGHWSYEVKLARLVPTESDPSE